MDDQHRPTLVLSRREGEALRIGESITIEVQRVGKNVRLAITAPPEVDVVREELVKSED